MGEEGLGYLLTKSTNADIDQTRTGWAEPKFSL